LLDEPLEGLAPLIRKELLKAFTLMSEESGTTIVLVEQQVREALEYAGRVLVMERGLSVYDGQSTDLLANPSSLERLVGCRGALVATQQSKKNPLAAGGPAAK